MNTSTTTITNATNGVITRITVIHHSHFRPGLLILALLAVVLIAFGLRGLFWDKGSKREVQRTPPS